MIIAVSGYNASGKTTLARALAERLERHQVPHKLVKFEKLYPGTWLIPKSKHKMGGSQEPAVIAHQVRALHSSHDRRFRWRDLANIVSAVAAVWFLRVTYTRKVVILERYFYDRFIFFNTEGWLYRLGMRIIPRPHALFILVPDEQCWQQRFLDRLRRQRTIGELSEADVNELALVRKRYKAFHRADAQAVLVDSTTEAGINRVWEILSCRVSKVIRTDAGTCERPCDGIADEEMIASVSVSSPTRTLEQ